MQCNIAKEKEHVCIVSLSLEPDDTQATIYLV